MQAYLLRVCRATSQLVNAILLGGDTDETCSAHLYRLACRRDFVGGWLRVLVDFIFSYVEGKPSHCKRSADARLARARKLLEQSCRDGF